MPATKVIAHLGPYDPIIFQNLKIALKAARMKIVLTELNGKKKEVTIEVNRNLFYLTIALISLFFKRFGLHMILDALAPPPPNAASVASALEALVAHRCIAPGSKLSFQGWIQRTAIEKISDVSPQALNNTRIHRVMDELADIDEKLQKHIRRQLSVEKKALIIYLDLTDTWFVAGGGSLSRYGSTKGGHRSKLKINIALLVNEEGLPLRWELLPGALNETTVLPKWIPFLNEEPCFASSVLVFDRGMPSVKNFQRLVDPDQGHLFLTSIKSDSIPTYVSLNHEFFEQLQELLDQKLPVAERTTEMEKILSRIGFRHFQDETYALELGVVTPPLPSTKRQIRPPTMRMYLYFNRDIQLTKSRDRKAKIETVRAFVSDLNKELKHVKQPRKEQPTRRKVERLLEKLSFTELFEVTLTPTHVQGRTKKIASFHIDVSLRKERYRSVRRFDGVSLMVGHPSLQFSVEESIQAYRQKDVVEAGFRTIKSVLMVRPAFHWTNRKIQSHVTICVISLLIERLIERELRKSREKIEGLHRTTSSLLKELDEVMLNIVRVGDKESIVRTRESSTTREILKCLDAEMLLEQFQTKHTYRH